MWMAVYRVASQRRTDPRVPAHSLPTNSTLSVRTRFRVSGPETVFDAGWRRRYNAASNQRVWIRHRVPSQGTEGRSWRCRKARKER
jgi:hypothetical protein